MLMFFILVSVGHGQSEGDRVHVNNFDEYVNDVLFHVDQVKEKHPDLPVFLIGHSMVIADNWSDQKMHCSLFNC